MAPTQNWSRLLQWGGRLGGGLSVATQGQTAQGSRSMFGQDALKARVDEGAGEGRALVPDLGLEPGQELLQATVASDLGLEAGHVECSCSKLVTPAGFEPAFTPERARVLDR